METTAIQEVKLYNIKLPLNMQYENSLGVKEDVNSVVIMITTDNGMVGFSSLEPDTPNYSEEAWYNVQPLIENEFIRLIKGEDPFASEVISRRLNDSVFGHLMSKALVETALLDLKGKIVSKPAYELLGGRVNRNLGIVGWVGIGRLESTLGEIERFLSQGYRCIKVKIGPDVDKDVLTLSEIRKKMGYEFRLRIDANQSLTRSSSMKLIEKISRLDIDILEQPVNRLDADSMRFLNRMSPIPIMADESVVTKQDMLRIIELEMASVVKVKVMRNGGVSETRKILAVAEAGGIDCVIGNGFSSSLGTMVEATVAATTAWISRENEFVGPLKLKRDLVREKPEFSKGMIKLRNGPGFGYTVEDLVPELQSSLNR